MRRVTIAALVCGATMLGACAPEKVQQNTVDASRYFSEKVLGTEFDMRLIPATADERGPLVVSRTRLGWQDGVQIPLAQIAPGLYRTPSLRTRYGAEGSRICGGRPVSYLSLHQGPGELYYLNAGDWMTAPAVPGHDAASIPGACETTTYRMGAG